MSDYEGEGWAPVQLTTPYTSAIGTDLSLNDHIGPNGRSINELHNRDRVASGRKGSLKAQPANTFHPLLQNIRPRAYHGTGGRPIERPIERPLSHKDPVAFKLFMEKPDDPDDVYNLDIPWGRLLRAIPDTAEFRARDIARSQFDNIGVFSEAFLRTPEPESHLVEIWGTKEQCEKAIARLSAWERHLRSTGARPSQKLWIKDHAFDGRREDRKRQEQWQELEDQALQELDDMYFTFEACLVWPDEFDLEAYIKRYEPSTLEAIAKEFRCRFRHGKTARPRHTKVQAMSEGDLIAAYQRLINLVKEMMAVQIRGTHGNFSRLPTPLAWRSDVHVDEIYGKGSKEHWTTLFGDTMPEAEHEEWLKWIKIFEKQNRIEIRASMHNFIKTLYMSQCHVKLRVSFGEVQLEAFRRGKNGLLDYDFKQFLAMIQEERTILTDPILRKGIGDPTSLVDSFTAMDEFKYPEESYRQLFEFKGSDSTNRLRLEIEMQRGYDLDEPQVCSQRWLTFKTYARNENVLGLKMFDFERPGYMIRCDTFNLFTNDNILQDMEAFRSAISFKPSRDGIKAFPKLRSAFPNHDKLMSVTEVTSVKFQFKDTDGIVEFRREDVYLQNTGAPSKLPDSTRFELQYYYPEWDNLLGELSNVKPGEDVSWERDILTFFPDYIDPSRPRSLPKGYKAFMKEVHEIQDLLSKALSE